MFHIILSLIVLVSQVLAHFGEQMPLLVAFASSAASCSRWPADNPTIHAEKLDMLMWLVGTRPSHRW